MKDLMNISVYLAKPFKIFILVMALLSVFGGYQLSQLIYRMNDYYLQRTEKILAMQGSIDDASIALGRQIQEWKDMLLRANDTELYIKHKKAFFAYSSDVQQALLNTVKAMKNAGMDTVEIEQLLIDHESLLSDYLLAKSRLNPLQIDSFREADQQVVGVDRNLQKHIAAIKAEIQHFSGQQLNETMPEQGNRYLLGLVGALSLLFMALAGFVFASRFQPHAIGTAEHISAT
jgi:methyl-accepting chemotaxis protein